MPSGKLCIYPDQGSLNRAVAGRIVAVAQEAVSSRGGFRIVLSGGSTPRSLYRLLASAKFIKRIDWSRTHVFFGDERAVPLDHPDSNYRMASEALLRHVPIPDTQVHPIEFRSPHPRQDAARYEAVLREHVPHEKDVHMPQFDLILLGLGSDGHTASLFPGTGILQNRTDAVAAVYVRRLRSWRISLTLPVLECARHLLFLIAGESKQAALHAALQPLKGEATPLALLRAKGNMEWHVDQAAAAALEVEDPV